MNPRSLLPCLVCSLFADVAAADEPSPPPPPQAPSSPFVEQARALVDAAVVTALEQRAERRSMFSRSPPRPIERRVRILDAAATPDARGKAYVRFAVDEHWEPIDEWNNDDITGCVYVDAGAVFVDVGDADGSRFRPAVDVFGAHPGKSVDVAVVCRPPASATPTAKPPAAAPTTTSD